MCKNMYVIEKYENTKNRVKFDANFHKIVACFCREYQLRITTTEIQKKNGTIQMTDDFAGCDYIMYESGYIRRNTPRYDRMYQLNPKKIVYFKDCFGRLIPKTIRVMLHPFDMLSSLRTAIINRREKIMRRKLSAFNINSDMYIQITSKGWKHLYQTLSEDYIECSIKPYCMRLNGEDWYRLTMWNVFELFPVRLGSDLFFKPSVMLNWNEISKIKKEIL